MGIENYLFKLNLIIFNSVVKFFLLLFSFFDKLIFQARYLVHEFSNSCCHA